MRRILSASLPARLATTAAMALLAAAAATFLVGEIEASPQTEPTPQHPCAGIPSITVTVTAADRAARQDLVRTADAPSSRCAVIATVGLSEPLDSGSPTVGGATCTINVLTNAGPEGTTTLVTGLSECGNLSVSTKIEVTPAGVATPLPPGATAATNSGSSTARARIGVYGFAPSGRIQSDVRGRWNHTVDSVILISLTYPLADTVAWLSPGPNTPSTLYGISPPSINAKNVIRWADTFDDLRLKTAVTLSMLAGGGYHCSHRATAYPSWSSLGANVSVRGECFP